MASSTRSHSRSHSLLLIQKLLNLRDSASPLTLVLDSLEQGAAPVIGEYISRAKASKSKVIFLSFSTLRKPRNADVFVKGRGKPLTTLRKELLSHYPKPVKSAGSIKEKLSAQRTLLIVDSLNELAMAAPNSLPDFLSGIIGPAVSLVGIYHTDVPLVLPETVSEYAPPPFTLLCYLATAILRLSSLRQEIERQKARNRSLQEPEWGLQEDREGVLMGLKGEIKSDDYRGVVLDMELRRRSGRAVKEKFAFFPGTGTPVPPMAPRTAAAAPSLARDKGTPSKLMLLSDHPVFAPPDESDQAGGGAGGDEAPESTFDLGLTEKQRRDREGIVLPYFDAQTDIGAGEGGRILYEMGREDDFDDEEDEI
ncbi:hypothetical protein ACRALDRAFT_1078606 [Sodiomyces alcalophilus JCM 7366]|uniref:uncharacterized protein n=1 Tax=Sodiomyces alcalophilus JCM 7366 TaxID=591952 RepID=UPI0039B53D66